MNNREYDIKKALEKDIYNKINRLENLKDETLSSTDKLANILDGYMTKIDGIQIDKIDSALEILDEEEIEIEVDDQDLLKDYNEEIHEFGLDTLEDLLGVENEPIQASEEFNEIEQIISSLEGYTQNLGEENPTGTYPKQETKFEEIKKTPVVEDYENTKSFNSNINNEDQHFTQTIISPVKIEQIDDKLYDFNNEETVEKEPIPEIKEKKTKNKFKIKYKFNKTDYILMLLVIILIIVLVFLNLR